LTNRVFKGNEFHGKCGAPKEFIAQALRLSITRLRKGRSQVA
jgi:hypothetical protein